MSAEGTVADVLAGSAPLRAPMSYFGGKRHAAGLVWSAIGDVAHFVEPFCGSAAVLLARPHAPRRETINDADGMVANFWRAVKAAPEAVAAHADWPVNEADLHARHGWLIGQREALTERLIADPEWFDAKAAGWWVWGARAWIGSGWCGERPVRQLPGIDPTGRNAVEATPALLLDLAARLRKVDVTCGDWSRVLTRSALRLDRVSSTGLLVDPPYREGNMDYAVGGTGTSLSADVRAWCEEHGDNPRLRIVLCGLGDEHAALEARGWRVVAWKANGGYGNATGGANAARERLWCSPHCCVEQPPRQPSLFDARRPEAT
jgi:DNA adenine methylase